jgi:hypothetical protein
MILLLRMKMKVDLRRVAATSFPGHGFDVLNFATIDNMPQAVKLPPDPPERDRSFWGV